MSVPEHEQGLGMEFALPGRQGGRPARPTGLPLQWKRCRTRLSVVRRRRAVV